MKRLFLLGLILILAACNAPQGENNSVNTASPAEVDVLIAQDITGADFPKPLALTDHTGKARTMDDFRGKVVVLFFGYTHCPDVCPTTMADLKSAMKLLGDKADDVQVLFVTVDPERDTQAILAQFVPSFDERFLGLYGTLQQTAETLGNFKVFYSKVAGTRADNYTIDHSAGSYVFDKAGKIRLYMQYGEKPKEIASDLAKLL